MVEFQHSEQKALIQARPPIRVFKKLVKSCWPRPYISLIRVAGGRRVWGGGVVVLLGELNT